MEERIKQIREEIVAGWGWKSFGEFIASDHADKVDVVKICNEAVKRYAEEG